MQSTTKRAVASTDHPLRIAMLAPPWISIPAPTYGGIEEVVRLLCQGLVARGHHVTLYAAPDSESDARVVEVLDEPHPRSDRGLADRGGACGFGVRPDRPRAGARSRV